MKKLFSILLLSIVLFNSFGFIILFALQQSNVKREMKSYALQKTDISKLVHIVAGLNGISDEGYMLSFNDENEFKYRGRMYDIIRKEITGNVVHYYCLNDTKEEQIIEEFTGKLKDNLDPNIIALKLKLSKLPFFAFSGLLEGFYQQDRSFYTASLLVSESELIVRFTDIDTPPPKEKS